MDVVGGPGSPKTLAMASASAASFRGVDVPCALMWATSDAITPASSKASSMQVTAPLPPGDGAVMWWASAVEAEPSTSARIIAPALFGRIPFLEHDHRSALGHHETVTATIEGPREPRRGDRGHVREAGDAGRGHRRLAATGDHRVAPTGLDQPGAVADRVRAGCARRRRRLARTLPAVLHRDACGRSVGHHHRHEEGRNTARPLLVLHEDLVLDGDEPADTRPDPHAATRRDRRRDPRTGRALAPRPRWRTARNDRCVAPLWGCRTTQTDRSPELAVHPPAPARAVPTRRHPRPCHTSRRRRGRSPRPAGASPPAIRASTERGRAPAARSRCPRARIRRR